MKQLTEVDTGTPQECRARSKRVPAGQTSWAVLVLIIGLGSASQVRGQMYQQKDLAFPQVAAGPTFSSVIAVTNCGQAAYVGTAHFWRGAGDDWNPRVNGSRVVNSRLQIMVQAGQTEILTIDDDVLAAGAVAILAEEPSQDNFLEGHLTYSNRGGDYDSVGIAPAMELYRTVVPFEDFGAVGLALVNADPNSRANLRLRLLDEYGTSQETVTRELLGRFHEARFLSEIFAGEVETGKVEIESDRPILGTAVTLANGEISSLPMLPSPVAYTVRFTAGGRTDDAEAVIWAEGIFVKGYLRFLALNGLPYEVPPTYLVSGTLVDGVLRLTQFGGGPRVGAQETINSLKVDNFSFEGSYYRGGYVRSFPWLSFPLNQSLGNYELTRRD